MTGIQIVAIDITERKQLEEQHVRQERLAAVGQLAAGIAHDFNNMLTTVMGYAELLQLESCLPISARSDLERIVKQSQRAAKLICQILDFSRQTVNEPHPLDMRAYLNETLNFIERTIPENIQTQFSFERGDYTVYADPTQLQQVITNLAVNARDAMPDGGTLHFDLSRINLTADELPPCDNMATGEWVRLAITDTGNGIPEHILPHIFEPFFTTKEIGQGAGLGLAQVYGIIQQHQGCITVSSEVGQGTTFTLYLSPLPVQAVTKDNVAEVILLGQGQTVLLVEDDQAVLQATQAMLEKLNYQVLTARDGAEALDIYRTEADGIAVVLTDAVMPRTNGFALASTLQSEAPSVPIVLMTGYANGPESLPQEPQNITIRLRKPISLHQMSQAVAQVLS